jgi:hypothetical protein
MAQHARHRHRALTLVSVSLLGMTAATSAAAAPYPPPDQPTTTTSASEVEAGQPVTLCAEHYGAGADVQLSDDKKKVTTLHTDGTGRGCATVVWKSPDASAKPVHKSDAAAGGVGVGASRRLGDVQLIAYRSPSGTVCHTMTNTGPDASGSSTATHAQVCVEPASDTTGSSSSGGSVRSNENSRLPFTGVQIAEMVFAALAALGVGIAAITAGRRRRGSGAR